MTVTLDSMHERWTTAERPSLRQGGLIDSGGCCCAQGDVLRCAGVTDDELRMMTQDRADLEVGRLLGISTAHSVLLRRVNDSAAGQPQRCLLAEQVAEYGSELLGPMHAELFAFFRRLDEVTADQWNQVVEAGAWKAYHAASHAAVTADQWRQVSAAGCAAESAVGREAASVASIAARALTVRHLIGQHEFTQEHYDAMTAQLRVAGIVVHPDDAPLQLPV